VAATLFGIERELPVGWRWLSMSDVCLKVQDGTHFSPKEQFTTGTYKYITAKNIKPWGLDLSELTYVSEKTHREIAKRCNPEKGDVLYIKDGVTTGIATVNPLDEEFSLLSSVALLKPRREIIDPNFLKYYLNSPEGFRNMTGQMTGTAIKRLILQKIKQAWVPVAPLDEQHRIVAEIEKQFTRLDAGVTSLKRVQVALKRYRASVLKAACEGRLVHTEAEFARQEGRSYEPASELLVRILKERRAKWELDQMDKFLAAGKLPKDEKWKAKYEIAYSAANSHQDNSELAEGWVGASVQQLGSVQLGRQRSPKHHSGDFMRPYLRVANVYEDRIDVSDVLEMNFTPEEFDVFRLEPNDILLNEGQSLELVGRPAIYRGEVPGSCFQNTLVRFRPYPGLLPQFALSVFRAYMHSGRFQKIARWTTNIAHLGADRFARMFFPLPPIAEQHRIVSELERRLSVIKALEATVAANLKRAERLRQSILHRAFLGRL
jgi:type I restriction enzyme S subunit